MRQAKKLQLAVLLALVFSALLIYRSAYQLDSEFEELMSASNFVPLNELKSVEWDSATIVQPYQTECFAEGRCISSFDDGECYFVFTRENQINGSVRVGSDYLSVCDERLPKLYPKERARFVWETVPTKRLIVEDRSWAERIVIDFELKDPIGAKAYCKVYSTGVGACDYASLLDCEKTLVPQDQDEACIENKLGARTRRLFQRFLG